MILNEIIRILGETINHTNSKLLDNINFEYKKDLGGYSASNNTVKSTTTSIEERTLSVASYADLNTKRMKREVHAAIYDVRVVSDHSAAEKRIRQIQFFDTCDTKCTLTDIFQSIGEIDVFQFEASIESIASYFFQCSRKFYNRKTVNTLKCGYRYFSDSFFNTDKFDIIVV